jgi:TetR/AcrR family transcriptional regulator, transcriptional repressor for nem operon
LIKAKIASNYDLKRFCDDLSRKRLFETIFLNHINLRIQVSRIMFYDSFYLTVRSKMVYIDICRRNMARPKNFDKDTILNLAMQVFWRQGYEATSVQDLVAHTKINKQSLYDTFGDKHSLYLAALNSYKSECESQFGSLLAENISAKATMQKLFDNLIAESISDTGHHGCFMNNAAVELASQDKEIGKACFDNMISWENKFVDLIKKGQKNNEIPTNLSAESVAAFLFTVISGLRSAGKINQDETKLKEIVKTALSILN